MTADAVTSDIVAFRSSGSGRGVWLTGIITLGLVVWAAVLHTKQVSNAVTPAMFAVVPGVIFVRRLISRLRRVSGVLDDSGIVIENPPQIIPYADLQALLMPVNFAVKPGADHFPLVILHASGVLSLPARMSVDARKLYRLLESRFPHSSPEQLPADLAAFHGEQVQAFGPDKVWSCRGRSILGKRPSPASSKFWGSVAWIGIGWIVLALASKAYEPWLGLGIFLAFFSGLIWVMCYSSQDKNWAARRRGSNEAIIISPIGLAPRQGELLGQLAWHDITAVQHGYTASAWLTTHREFGIRLKVSGADFMILDCYDQPLSRIHQKIIENWRPPAPVSL